MSRLLRYYPVRRALRAVTGYAWDRNGRVPCEYWPCRRCDRAGRSSWRSRKAWHAMRRELAGLAWRWTWPALLTVAITGIWVGVWSIVSVVIR